MNIPNTVKKSGSATAESAAPEKLVIRDRTDAKIFFERLLLCIQTLIKVVFFIGFGAIKIALERLCSLKKTASDVEAFPSLDSAQGQPQRIKVPLLPIDNYSQLNPDCIVKDLIGLSAEQLTTVRDFEAKHQNRNRILEAIDSHLAKTH